MAELSACPECKRTLQVPESYLGQVVQCPECGHQFTAMASAISEKPSTAPSPAPSPKPQEKFDDRDEDRRRRYDDEDDDFADLDRHRRIRDDFAPHRGGLILALGLISLLGFMMFYLPGLLGPVAWALGSYDLREMRERRMDPTGEGMTQAGRVLGIVATALLTVLVSIVCFFVAVFALTARH